MELMSEKFVRAVEDAFRDDLQDTCHYPLYLKASTG
jgi:hypothetical protein